MPSSYHHYGLITTRAFGTQDLGACTSCVPSAQFFMKPYHDNQGGTLQLRKRFPYLIFKKDFIH